MPTPFADRKGTPGSALQNLRGSVGPHSSNNLEEDFINPNESNINFI